MIWLLNCWFYTQKQNVFGLDEKIPPQHYGHLLLANCISELLILQQPLKHVSKWKSIHGLHQSSNNTLIIDKNHLLISR